MPHFFICIHVLSTLEFDSNHISILTWKFVNLRDHNEIKSPNEEIFQKYKPITNYFVMSQKLLSCSLQKTFTTIVTRYPISNRTKEAITWKLLSRRKWIFLSKLDLSKGTKKLLFKSMSLRLKVMFVLSSIKLLGEISDNWPNDLLGINLYKSFESYC